MKALDDKELLVQIFLTESQCNFDCGNIPKAKGALTAAKTNANAIHCPPLIQADIDLQSGIVALREEDARTAFSYLYEAYEAFNINKGKESRALQGLRLQLLCRIMQDDPKACKGLVTSKSTLKYQTQPSIQALLKIAAAYEDRSLRKLEQVLREHPTTDEVIKHHLKELYERFLEKNLLKILEPFSRVEIAHVADLIELDVFKTQSKLSQMILDGKLAGTLDQGNGILQLYAQADMRPTCKHALEIIKNTADCVDSLGTLSKKIYAN